MAQEKFSVDGTEIKAPDSYKPVFATTSTDDSDRTQDGVMHNTPMFTISGYDLTWGFLTSSEISTILNGMIGKSKFSFHHRNPKTSSGWSDADFYASNFSMAAQSLKDGEEGWDGLAINVRSTNPV